MKVRKEVSLTPETYAIAARMKNFSQWVRIGLRHYSSDNDITKEIMLRIRWAKAAHHLAAALVERALEIDPEWTIKGYEQDPVAGLINQAYSQTTLEEFE